MSNATHGDDDLGPALDQHAKMVVAAISDGLSRLRMQVSPVYTPGLLLAEEFIQKVGVPKMAEDESEN